MCKTAGLYVVLIFENHFVDEEVCNGYCEVLDTVYIPLWKLDTGGRWRPLPQDYREMTDAEAW